ncbi:MAG: hypothetical protein C0498_13345, partial [Anaerolinea sp.]|nr:hypothetical protein [Anaerolinea sp.]
SRPPSARSINDETLKAIITRVHRAHFGVYGVRKAWRTLGRLGIEAGRDQVRRLMRVVGLEGATRTKRVRTTRPAVVAERPADLVSRTFTATTPNRLWLADLTDVSTWSGFVYTAFVIDAFSPGDRRLAGDGQPPRRARPRRPRDGALGPGPRPPGPRPPQRPGRPVPVDPVHRAPRRGRGGGLGRIEGRQL